MISRKDAVKEFMYEYKYYTLKANRPGVDVHMLYRELYAFYTGMTRAISYDTDMPFSEYHLIYTFMLRKLDTFFRVYVLNK